MALEPTDPLFRSFNKIFQAFKIVEEPKEEKETKKEVKYYPVSLRKLSISVELEPVLIHKEKLSLESY